MKTSVLHFSGENPLEDTVLHALFRSGIRVKRVKSLSKLHLHAATGAFDAILVERAITERYHVKVSRHQWESRSPMAIVTWSTDESGSVEIVCHARPASVTGRKRAERNENAMTRIRDALSSIKEETRRVDGMPTPTVKDAQNGHASAASVSLPPLPEGITLHKKAQTLLDIVRESGDQGADTARIAETLWPGEGLGRKRDIQSYMARLRGTLDRAFPGSYRIVRQKDRYILKSNAR
jgi:hypothetical protein